MEAPSSSGSGLHSSAASGDRFVPLA